ncbi:ankyrin repeat-containing domain protein [Cenococcum geophilum]
MQRWLIDLSRGLAELREHAGQMVVQFNHQTVYGFLRDKGFQIIEEPSRLDMSSLSRVYHELARCCILYFATKEILWATGRDIPSLNNFFKGRTDLVDDASEDMQVEFDEIEIKSGTEHSVSTALSLAPTLAGSISESALSGDPNDVEIMIKSYPFISYSTEYWLDYAELAERNGISQENLLKYFRWPSDQILRHWIRMRQHVFSDRSEAGLTLMHIAAKRGLLSLCRAIAEKAETKKDVDKPDDNGWTLLMHAAACQSREAIVEFLLNQGADPNTKDGEWETPLFKVTSRGGEATTRLLLEHDADPNLATWSNDTAVNSCLLGA